MTPELQMKLHAVFVKAVKAEQIFADIREVISETAGQLDHDNPEHAAMLVMLYRDSDILKVTEQQFRLHELALCAVNNEFRRWTGYHPMMGYVGKGEL